MKTNLPISRLINVGVSLTPPAAQSQNLSTLLLLASSDVIDVKERTRSYSSIDEVAADFNTDTPEYLGALLWFEQAPQPTTLTIGRWAKVATHGKLVGSALSVAEQDVDAWKAIANGAFQVSVDGGALADVSGLDFSAVTNLNGVASVINLVLVGATCVWNATYSRFEFTSATTGAGSSVGFLVAPAAGTNIVSLLGGGASDGGYQADGIVAEDAINAVQIMENEFGQQWYALVCPEAANGDHLEIAAYVEALTTKHVYGITSQEGGVLSAVDTTNIAYLIKQQGYRRTATQYSSKNKYAVCSLLARILTTNYNANNSVITLMYKQEPGIEAEQLTGTQMDALLGFNCNVFVEYNNNTAIIQPGVMGSGDFIDTITGVDWLAVTIQTALYNLLYTSTTKVPQDDRGMHMLQTVTEQVCVQAVNNGLLAPGVWNSQGFGTLEQNQYMPKGFYVYAAPIAQQTQADRQKRKSVPIQVAAKLAGAVHTADVQISVNQ